MTRALRLMLIAAFVWVLAGIPTSAPAQFDNGPFAGFAMDAWGSAFSMIYDDPNGPVPAHPTGEMHAAYAIATLTDGPSGHGVGSVFWPGATTVGAGPFIEDSFWDGVEDGSDGQFPPSQIGRPELTPRQWPTAAEVFEPTGPHTSDVIPNSHAHSTESLVLARSHVGAISIPGVFSADDGGAVAQTFVGKVKDGDTTFDGARAEVVSTATDIAVGTGPVKIKIDAVTTTVVVTSDGAKPTITGETLLAGLTINGQGFTLDDGGFHANDESNPVTQQLNAAALEALAESGISLTLAQPIDTTKKAEGARSAGGLVVRMQSTRFDEMVSKLPDDLEKQVRANMSTTHDLTLIFGAANVRSSALKAFEFTLDEDAFFDFEDDDDFDSSVLGASLDAGSFDGGSFDAGPIASPDSSGGGQTFVNSSPAFAGPVSVEGVAVVSAIIALALALGAARGLKRLSDTLLVAGGGGPSCPLGDEE